jgi:hypothetical protein
MRFALILAAAIIFTGSRADADGLTVAQCLNVLNGLNSLNYAGQQLGEPKPPADAKQYKLGELRGTISFNIAALAQTSDATQRARTALVKEAGGGEIKPGTPEMERFLAAFQVVLDKPCDAKLARFKLSELRLGDEPDRNAIPPSVLGALEPIIDR